MGNPLHKYDTMIRGWPEDWKSGEWWGTATVSSMYGAVASSNLVNSDSVIRLNIIPIVSGGSEALPLSFMVESIYTGVSFMISHTCSIDLANSYTVQWEIVNPK